MANALTYLATINPHERDARIDFQEEGHIYIVDGEAGQYTSVTTVIHGYFSPFVADNVIAGMMASPNWPNSEYFGMTPQEIKDQWEAAAALGTTMHAQIELFFNRLPQVQQGDLAELPQPDTTEFKHFMQFYNDHVKGRFVPFRTEMRVFDEDVLISGSIDMLFRDVADPTRLYIYDWKRTKQIKTSNRFANGLGPMQHLQDCNLSHYSLQLNLYKRILEGKYGYHIAGMALCVFHPNQRTYQLIHVDDMADEIDAIYKERGVYA